MEAMGESRSSFSKEDIDPKRAASFWSKVQVWDPHDCWPWLQSCGSHGYGQTWTGKTVTLAHRMAWVLAVGTIPAGLTIDHMCRNRTCQNPRHLRLMSNVENASANGASLRTHCPQRHEYDEANTYVDTKGHRRCRQCARDRRKR